MQTLVSAGVILYRMNEGIREYLLLKYKAGHWDFSKGGGELGEDPEETAERELQEETGLDVDIIPGFEASFRYLFRMDKEIVRKKVTLFVGQALGDTVTLSSEHLEYKWLPFDQAKEQLTYENAQEALTQANMFLKNV